MSVFPGTGSDDIGAFSDGAEFDAEDESDEEFNIEEKKARRSDYVTVELPRNPLASLEVTSSLDRSNISNRKAMQVFSAVRSWRTMTSPG